MTNNKEKMTTKTQILAAIFVIATLTVAIPGLGEAFAAKTYATFWIDPDNSYRGISVAYEAEDEDNRSGWIAGPTWMRSVLEADLVEIGWLDENLTRDAYYYAAEGGSIDPADKWGSPSTGDQTTYYIYDPQDDGNIDLIGGGDSREFDIGSYSIYKLEVGIEDSNDSNSVIDDIKHNIKWYDGTWNLWDDNDGTPGENESHSTAYVDRCTSNDDVEIGDSASC